MNNPLKPKKKTELEVVRTKAIADLQKHTADSDEYKKIAKHIASLSEQIKAESREKLSPNTIAVVLGNIGIASLVLWYERDNVMNTKMFSFFGKPKS